MQTNRPEQPKSQLLIHNSLEFTGKLLTLGNRHNLTPIKLRRIGAPLIAAALLSAGAYIGEGVIDSSDYSLGTNIPSSIQHLDPHKYKMETIPSTGAFDFASHVDPNHDPRNGVQEFQDQLHSAPEPHDKVAVPIITK